MRARSQAATSLTLASLPDDVLQQIIAAFSDIGSVDDTPRVDLPLLKDVKGLACSKGMLQQLRRLRPLVGVNNLAVVQRSYHGPWRVVLLYEGELTEAVVEQARQGRVHSIFGTQAQRALNPAVAERVVPMLLGAGCSLLELYWLGVKLNGTWAATFGEEAVCSLLLRSLSLDFCGLQGPLPKLRLPALQVLDLDDNDMSGSLEPLGGCTALLQLTLSRNQLTGGLEPLRGCTALEMLHLSSNRLSGGLESLRRCTALTDLRLNDNNLTGGLEPLRGCAALEDLLLYDNHLTGELEPLRRCTALQDLWLSGNDLTGGLDALQGCTALRDLRLSNNQCTGGLEPLRSCKALQELYLDNNRLTGGLEPLWGCTALKELSLENNQLVLLYEDRAHFEEQCEAFLS